MKFAQYKTKKDIKVGVIGYGGAFNMGLKHLRECKKAGMTPFAVCDVDPARLKIADNDWPGIETYTDLAKMLKESAVDLIIHITPHNLHYKLAAQCLKAGKHVITEKPFVLTTAEADKLIKLAEQKNLLISTYHNRHWDGWIMRARREVVDKKILGDVYRIESKIGDYGMPGEWWRTSKSISGGVLYDWGVHLLEYGLQIMPGSVTEVAGYARTDYWSTLMPKSHPWKKDANEDEARLTVRFDDGNWMDLTVSQLMSKPLDYHMAIYGTKGCYLINFKEGWTTRIANRKGELVEKTGDHPKPQSQKFYDNIADAMAGKAELVITPQWARRPIHILDLAGKSVAAGKAIKAKYG